MGRFPLDPMDRAPLGWCRVCGEELHDPEAAYRELCPDCGAPGPGRDGGSEAEP